MLLKIEMQLNPRINIEANFEGSNLQDCIQKAGVLLDFEGQCGFCSSTDVTLQTRNTKDKKYKYTEFLCRKCGAKRPFGAYQDGSGFFLKAWEEKFQGNVGQ